MTCTAQTTALAGQHAHLGSVSAKLLVPSTPITASDPAYYYAESVTFVSAGFTAPVDLNDILNIAKAGQTIPLKWRLLDNSGAPIAELDPASVTITVSGYTCEAGIPTDAIETYAVGASGLQNLGDAYYQYNWKTLKTYANSCRQLTLKIGNWSGDGFTALFQFKK
jgi:hypothetical protein